MIRSLSIVTSVAGVDTESTPIIVADILAGHIALVASIRDYNSTPLKGTPPGFRELIWTI